MSITLTAASFDKTSYAPGDLVTLTIGYTSTDVQADPGAGSSQYAVQLTLTDTAGTTQPVPTNAPITIYTEATPATEPQPVSVGATETVYPGSTPTGRTWGLTSNTLLTFSVDTGVSTWQAVLSVQLPGPD